ncbi:MAG TPA: acyl-CoA dehydrogenase family protein [Sporichthya sp.]|nr:acyl-CoA dehydrogenase family protein [Sporichthya sp.]
MSATIDFDALLGLTDDEQKLISYVASVAQDKIAPRAEEYDQSGEFPWDNVRLLNELGLNGVFIPEQYGGTPLSYSCYLRLVEEISKACPSTAITWATTFHAISPVITFGTAEQKERYLPVIADGGLAAVAITETSGGSDAFAMKSTLTVDGDELVLSGDKVFITNGDVADVMLVFAKGPGGEGRRSQLACVLVDKGTPGLEVVRREHKLGHRASSTVELRFDNVRVPRSNLLGELTDGVPILFAMLNKSRPSVAAEAIGIAAAAFDLSREYVNERKQFGQRILDFQGVQFMFADMAVKLTTARSLLAHVGRLVDGGCTDFDVEASILKLAASDAAMAIATNAVQLHGGYGYITGSKAERLFRDAKLTQIWEGANELHRARIGKSFLH